MLTSYWRLSGLAIAVLTLFGCSKSEDETPAPSAPMGISWLVDGVPVKTSDAPVATTGSSGPGNFFIVTGAISSDGTNLQIYLPLPLALGTYPIAPGSGSSGTATASYTLNQGSGSSPFFRAESGSISVTAIDNQTFSGTFSFTAPCASSTCLSGSRKVVTDGKFHISR
jgi:hypothetical protein